jgi:hypothetical protein
MSSFPILIQRRADAVESFSPVETWRCHDEILTPLSGGTWLSEPTRRLILETIRDVGGGGHFEVLDEGWTFRVTVLEEG